MINFMNICVCAIATAFLGKRGATLRPLGTTVLIFAVISLLALPSRALASPVIYLYVGNNFDTFSCGGGFLCADPTPEQSSYTTDDFVTATLTLEQALPGGLYLQDITGFAGFELIMNDGHQQLVLEAGVPAEALISTDADGNIIEPWSLIINCCPLPNNGIHSLNWPEGRGVGDGGMLSGATFEYPDTPWDLGGVSGSPGVWSMVDSGEDDDGDGVPDNDDACPNSIADSTVVIGGTETGVANTSDAAGCSLADKMNEALITAASQAMNHGHFASSMAKYLSSLVASGQITPADKDALMAAVASADESEF